MKQPHPKILAMLQGADVPADFKCDGCTMSPDGWFYWACRIHDWEASLLRLRWESLQSMYGDDHMAKTGETYIKSKYESYFRNYNTAQRHLRDNIKILSTFYVNKHGDLRVRKWYNPKRVMGWPASKLYAAVTGSMFKWATTGGKS